MAWSLTAADRSTHVKIAAAAIIAATAMVMGLEAHVSRQPGNPAGAPSALVLKAGSPVNVTSQTGVVVR